MENIKYIRCCSEKEIVNLMDAFKSQFRTSSKWHIEKIDIQKIVPLCKYVYSDRLMFARNSIQKCITFSVPLLYPYVVKYNTGKSHLVVPPIVEERNQLFFLGDGMHRIYSLLELNILTAFVLITHDCILPLPGIPQDWSKVKENNIQLSCEMNFENFSKIGLTGYSKFCNGNFFWECLEE